MIAVIGDSMLVESKHSPDSIILYVISHVFPDGLLTPFLLHPIHQLLILHTRHLMNVQHFRRPVEFLLTLRPSPRQAQEVHIVIRSNTANGGREEHGLVIGMGGEEEDRMLARSFVILFVEVEEENGEGVEGDEDPLEGDVEGVEEFFEHIREIWVFINGVGI